MEQIEGIGFFIIFGLLFFAAGIILPIINNITDFIITFLLR